MLTDQNPDAMAAGVEDPPRVKLLCSFGGSILPRPLDGKLRYVGGETRIVALPRSASYDDFMSRMKELFDGAWAIKYQQPDEDLDALVSIVNDDDVVNMMEEYDKLGSTGEGFTRLRVFLFAHPSDHDASSSPMSSPQYEVDERETERRYVDALNSLSDSKPISPDSTAADMGVHGNQFGNLHRLTIPRLPSHGQIFNEMDGSWSPAGPAPYYSPGNLTPREFPPSPSAGRFHGGIGDLSDRVQEEYTRHSPANYEHGSPFVDNSNVVWLPPGGLVGEMSGFPGNLGHTHGVYEGGSGACEHCFLANQRNQNHADARHHDPQQMHGQLPHIGGNEFSSQFSNSCADCVREREAYFKDYGLYANEQVEHYPPFFNDFHGRDRNWTLHHQLSHHPEMIRGHRNEYFVDGSGMTLPFRHSGHSGPYNGHPMTHRDDPHYSHLGSELHSGAYHEQNSTGALENSGVRYANNDSPYGTESPYQIPHNSSSNHGSKRNMQGPILPSSSYEVPGSIAQSNGFVNKNYVRCDQSQSPLVGHNGNTLQKIHPIDGIHVPEHYRDHAFNAKLNIKESHSATHEPGHAQSRRLCNNDPIYAESVLPLHTCLVEGRTSPLYSVNGGNLCAVGNAIINNNLIGDTNVTYQQQLEKEPNSDDSLCPKESMDVGSKSNSLTCCEEVQIPGVLGEPNGSDSLPNKEGALECSKFLTELISSVKEAVLDGPEEVKPTDQADSKFQIPLDPNKKESSLHESEPKNIHKEIDSDDEQPDISKIEPTSAEMEALAKGLQVIKNDDLEEKKELGNGAYGSVYHGKWRGSDVAIKRIKSSCFSGKPSERERLIADFWKEACILSSLHHPNVVSFYGVVRDGRDGNLATVTEFMVNGSLKQFLQKKDRTIDRRKRLIIAMDAAFGMEYLHEKNVVHFDLKCENLLVNMRDPHRPVCKIGDLGLSKVKQQTLVSGGVRGTIPWMAPELLSGKSDMVTEKVDVYSFGIVMWELLTGEDPYTDMHFASIIGGIVNSTLRPQVPAWCDPEWKSLMESCWSSDPGERPSFCEISEKLRKMAASINVK